MAAPGPRLDQEFKEQLVAIRSYVLALTDLASVRPCCAWIQRLSRCCSDEKLSRNQHLAQLCEQLRHGQLRGPFRSAPPAGPLPALPLQDVGCWSDASTPTELTATDATDATDIAEPRSDCSDSPPPESGVSLLCDEVEYLKLRLVDLIAVKATLQSSHDAIVKQLEQSVLALQQRLQEEQHKSGELARSLQAQQHRSAELEEALRAQSDSGGECRRRLEESVAEMDALRQSQLEALRELEDRSTRQAAEAAASWQQQEAALRAAHAQQLATLAEEHRRQLADKADEILKLEHAVEEEHSRMQQEIAQIRVNIEDCPGGATHLQQKVVYMQRCIIKMEKLLRKYEKHYSKKVACLRNELVLKESTMQIQLTSQRAQMLATVSSEKQQEIEGVVAQLEQRYRELLESQQLLAFTVRNQDQQLIQHLRDKLQAHNISC